MNNAAKVIWRIVSGNRTVRKATNALAVTLIGGLGTALIDGKLTALEVGAAIGVALVATSAVWEGDNKGDEAEEQGKHALE